MRASCYYCGDTEELRPYGPGGAPICFVCGSHPERKKAVEERMGAIMSAAAAMSDIGSVAITATGFHPFTSADAAEIEGRAS